MCVYIFTYIHTEITCGCIYLLICMRLSSPCGSVIVSKCHKWPCHERDLVTNGVCLTCKRCRFLVNGTNLLAQCTVWGFRLVSAGHGLALGYSVYFFTSGIWWRSSLCVSPVETTLRYVICSLLGIPPWAPSWRKKDAQWWDLKRACGLSRLTAPASS